jgi:uncharacterized protein (TIGR02757 family)
MTPGIEQVKSLLNHKYFQYNREEFLEGDPVSVPHLFHKKEDIEIAAFLTATISWGQRVTIVDNARKLMERMDFSPYEFILQAGRSDLKRFNEFRHRTFNQTDLDFFMLSLQNIYRNHSGLEAAFVVPGNGDIKSSISKFRDIFLSVPHESRSEKHIANPSTGSPAKRINMFLRWMVRKDHQGVDFGIWGQIRQEDLMCPLDIHSGAVARKLGLITRPQNDWKALEELMMHLRRFDPADPAKYDFALFGLGIFEGF